MCKECLVAVGFIILLFGGFVYLMYQDIVGSAKYDEIIQEYKSETKYIKEMTSETGISGKISGSSLLIFGGVYGTIDTQRVMTLIFKTNANNGERHRVVSLPLDSIDIITIDANEKPYLFIKDGEKLWNNDKQTSIQNKDTTHYKITRIDLYLPAGWEIIEGASVE